jgi:hypothetical protein
LTIRCLIYTRVSREEQVEGWSLDAQRDQCLMFAGARGWEVSRVFEELETWLERWSGHEERDAIPHPTNAAGALLAFNYYSTGTGPILVLLKALCKKPSTVYAELHKRFTQHGRMRQCNTRI